MHYAEIKTCDIANGPGVRTSLFVSGCTHRCKGCFNEIAWDFNYGRDFTDDTIKEIIDSLAPVFTIHLSVKMYFNYKILYRNCQFTLDECLNIV